MFTGIVQGCARVLQRQQTDYGERWWIQAPNAEFAHGLVEGASVALNGTCLTLVQQDGERLAFDAIPQTLQVTNLGEMQIGDRINVERAARFGDEIGGHAMSGHINCVATVREWRRDDERCILWLDVPQAWRKYLMLRGYVGLDGCSLTIAELDDNGLSVHLIPETLKLTRLGDVQPGMGINLEVDPQTQAIVTTVERVLAQRGLDDSA